MLEDFAEQQSAQQQQLVQQLVHHNALAVLVMLPSADSWPRDMLRLPAHLEVGVTTCFSADPSLVMSKCWWPLRCAHSCAGLLQHLATGETDLPGGALCDVHLCVSCSGAG